MKNLYKHDKPSQNREFEKVYKNIEDVNIESKKQRSISSVKSFPSTKGMKEGILYIDDNFEIRVKKNGIIKKFTLEDI